MAGSWLIGLALNGIVGAAFLAIGLQLAARLTVSRQWRTNPVAAVFSVLIVACGAGHAVRAALVAGPSIGLFGTAGLATQVEFTDWHIWIADAATAFAGVFYVVARWRDRDILETTRVFDDYRSRRARALAVHDDVVQELNRAQIAIDTGRDDDALQALDEGLEASKAVISRIEGQPLDAADATRPKEADP